MKNMFNKANAPYIVSSTLAIATLLTSGVFATAPYVGFLAPVAALSVGLPFIIGGAVFSVAVIALSSVMISKNKNISQQKNFENRVARRKEEEVKAKDAIPDVIALSYKNDETPSLENLDCLDLATSKDLSQLDVKISSPESQLAKNKDLNHEEVKGRASRVAKYGGIATCALAMAALTSKLLPTPVCISVSDTELSGQQTHLCQADGDSTINSSPAYYVPTPQIVLENKINEYSGTLADALESAKNNFGIPQDYPAPKWFNDLHKNVDSVNQQSTFYDVFLAPVTAVFFTLVAATAISKRKAVSIEVDSVAIEQPSLVMAH